MKISLCLPTFARPEMLSRALASVASQSYTDYEVVVKDGCPERPSTNLALLRAQFGTDRVHYIAGRDGGLYRGLNEALRAATGDILYFMCDDDLLAPGALAEVAEQFKGNLNRPYWLYGAAEIIDINDTSSGMYRLTATSFSELLTQNTLCQPSVFWNRAIREACPGDILDEYQHSGDYEMWLRFWHRQEPAYTPKVLGKYRAWRETHTHNFLDDQRREAVAISEKWRNRQ